MIPQKIHRSNYTKNYRTCAVLENLAGERWDFDMGALNFQDFLEIQKS